MRRTGRLVASAAAALAAGAAAVGCSASTTGTVTAWTYTPPTVQTVDTGCSWWSGSSSSKYSSSSGSSYCLDEDTAQEPMPQVCQLALSSGATFKLDVGQEPCKSYLGQHWPIGGSTTAAS